MGSSNFLINFSKVNDHFISTNMKNRDFTRYFVSYCNGWEIYQPDNNETLSLAPPHQLCNAQTDEIYAATEQALRRHTRSTLESIIAGFRD